MSHLTSPEPRVLPLGLNQEPFSYLDQQHPGTAASVRWVASLQGQVELAALDRALAAAVVRQPILGCRFCGGALEKAGTPRVEEGEDLSAVPELDAARRLLTGLKTPDGGLRVVLSRHASGRWLVGLVAHQAVADAGSLQRLLVELLGPAPMPPPEDYLTLAPLQRERLRSGELGPALAFWSERLQGAPAELQWPFRGGKPRPEGPVRTVRSRVTLPQALVQRAQQAGLDDVLTAAVAALVVRYCRQEEVLVGVSAPGRAVSEAHLFGPFAQALPLRLRAEDRPTAQEWLDRVRVARREALSHDQVNPELAAPRTGPSQAGLIQVLVHPAEALGVFSQGAVEGRWLVFEQDDAWVDLAVSFSVGVGGTLQAAFEARQDRVDRGEAEALPAHFVTLLEGLLARPSQTLQRLPLLSDAERARLISLSQGPLRQAPPETTPSSLFWAQVEAAPEHPAVQFGTRTLSYLELGERVRRLARHLRAQGVGPGARVALLLRPQLDLVTALLAVLETGGAYVALDVDAPEERLRFICEDAGVQVALAEAALVAALEVSGRRVIPLEEGWETRLDGPPAPLGARPEQLAYIVYTSGSTGEPKGVMVPNHALANHNLAIAELFGLKPEDRVLQFTPVQFDAAGEEIYPVLAAGATVVVRDELVPAEQFCQMLEQEALTVLSLPPAFLHQWVLEMERLGLTLPRCVRLVVLGGERLLPESWAIWNRVGGEGIPWLNVYGPSEATITAASFAISGDTVTEGQREIPMGRPISNVEAFVVDEHQELVPHGHAGELLLGGAGLAWGYLNRPDLTAERFIADPFSEDGGKRLYRTGDRVRTLADGGLEFLGRTDHQVKIRGFRVELGEVEAVLRQVPGVTECVLIATGEGAQRKLVAYVAGADGALNPRELRQQLAAKLPAYMVPAAFVSLPALPLTVNGKVDRKALPPPPEETAPEVGQRLSDPIEAQLAELWSEVLGTPVTHRDADFFELGGHSLTAMQLVSRVQETMGVELELRLVFDTPTLGAMAGQLAELLGPAAGDVDDLSEDQVEAMLRDLLAKSQP